MRPDRRRSLLELRTSLRIAWARLYAPLLMRRHSLPQVLQRLTWTSGRLDGSAGEAHQLRGLRLIEQGLTRLRFVPDTCLYRALARYSVVSGYAEGRFQFVMGVRRENQAVIGHAWLERNGKPLETIDPALVVTFRYPASSADAQP